MLFFNIIMDYFRCKNMNYSYSVVMRQFDKTVDEIVSNSDLVKLLQLEREAEKHERLRVPALQLLMGKLNEFEAGKSEY